MLTFIHEALLNSHFCQTDCREIIAAVRAIRTSQCGMDTVEDRGDNLQLHIE